MNKTISIQEPQAAYGFKTYEDLQIWQKSMDLVTQVYNLSEHLPKSEDYILSSQIKRAAISIPSNISEGWARKSNKAFANFLKIAFGSLHEVLTQLQIIKNLFKIDISELRLNFIELSKMINGFIKYIEYKHQNT